MLIKRLLLRNYRVYEELELELPSGLVGIYGPNGAGKSYLIESIRWTLFGRSRTSNDDVRTDGVGGECITEVEFEHEGHLYRVRRTITPGGAVKALAHADDLHVAEGVQDTARYLRSVLGMDDAAFRASVFAEQKQVAAFSEHTPAKRKDLVLRLLGITPLDRARDQARSEAKLAREQHAQLRDLLPDLDARRSDVSAASHTLAASTVQADAGEAAAAARRAELEAAVARADSLADLEREHRSLVQEGRAARQEMEGAAERAGRLETELAELDQAEARLVALAPEAARLAEVEARLRGVEAVAEAERALTLVALPPEPPEPDDDGVEAARARADAVAQELAALRGRRSAADADVVRASEAATLSTSLSAAEACPVCGQELGAAFEQVRTHRTAELTAAQARRAELDAELGRLGPSAAAAAADADAAVVACRQARAARQVFDQARARRAAAEQALTAALAAVDPLPRPGEVAELTAEVDRRREANAECQRLHGRLERRVQAATDLQSERDRMGDAAGRRQALLEKVQSLGFDAAAAAAARATADSARLALDTARDTAHSARLAAATAAARLEAAELALAEAVAQHEKVADEGERVRHLGRAAELLARFRETIVAAVGPSLALQAADLFAELTNNEYDRLEVDPETYEIQIRDAGRLHGMDRFSGSETDLANLALRVAISEHVRFQSGGQVGLLVLDEVFGPLDDERKERMLVALERLRAHFRQVLVVTHDSGIKEQLPSAIEVVKLSGRRATARLLAP